MCLKFYAGKILCLLLFFIPCSGFAMNDGFFVGYETLEMSMNKFDKFAGEVGYRFKNDYQLRLTIMDVMLTERHLSSSEAAAVDGHNVEGLFRGYELNLDKYFHGRWYYSFNIGRYTDRYQHIEIADARINNTTVTIGSGVGYLGSDIFGIENLYVNFNVPVRFYFDKIKETKLGDATVREHLIVNNIWLFLGYRF